jgi:charged multivesicular body protein 2A
LPLDFSYEEYVGSQLNRFPFHPHIVVTENMGSLFGKEKPLKEIVRENQRMIKKAIRELEKEIENLKRQDKKLTSDIKKSAKLGQMPSVRIMAKDLVRTRSHVTRFIEMKTHLNAVALKMQTIKSHDAMANAMKGVTKALIAMNAKVSIPGLQKVMNEFLRENERAELTQEVLGETLDDAMAEEGSSAQEDLIVNQVLDELGVGAMGELAPEAPKGVHETSPAAGTAVGGRVPQMTGADGSPVPNGGTAASPSADAIQLSDLEIRLQNLSKKP